MSKLYDEDGIDGPFNRGMEKPMRQTTRKSFKPIRPLDELDIHSALDVKLEGTPYQVVYYSDKYRLLDNNRKSSILAEGDIYVMRKAVDELELAGKLGKADLPW